MAGLSTLNNQPINNIKLCRNMCFHTTSDVFKNNLAANLFCKDLTKILMLSITKVGLISMQALNRQNEHLKTEAESQSQTNPKTCVAILSVYTFTVHYIYFYKVNFCTLMRIFNLTPFE